jgi:glycosyl hydrolase family 16/Calx-beta domain-containing protein
MKIVSIFFIIFIVACAKSSGGSGGGGNTNQVVPSVKISDVTQSRQDTGSVCRFYVDLSAVAAKQTSVQFTTQDGSAVAGKDYTAQSGTLTFAAGQQELYIDVHITGDSLRQSQQVFYVQLSNPVSCTIRTSKATGTVINDGIYLPTDTTGYRTASSYPGYNLVWSDEFSGNAVNTQNWNFESGGSGWGNHELENYTSRPQNVFVSSGNLIIEARQETYSGNNYTSARMNTASKQQFQYGRIDIRAKLPVAKGMWPALWMLGSNFGQAGWPACGETDIMELIGTNPKQVVGSYHWKQTGGAEGTINNTYSLASQDFSQQFHVFSLIWAQDSLQMLVDDQVYVSTNVQAIGSAVYPFNASSFFIFNVAVGGDWPGPPDNTTVFPQRMFVDYVRVFQK